MAPRITLKIKNNFRAPSEYHFAQPCTCLIGRGPDCDLRLPSEKEYLLVSRHHCRLEIDPPHVRVRDLGSRNGTRLNGMQIGHPYRWGTPAPDALVEYELHNGDELAVGPAVFEVRAEERSQLEDRSDSGPANESSVVSGEAQATRQPGPAAVG